MKAHEKKFLIKANQILQIQFNFIKNFIVQSHLPCSLNISTWKEKNTCRLQLWFCIECNEKSRTIKFKRFMLSLRSSFFSLLCLVFTGNIRNVSCVWWYITSPFVASFYCAFHMLGVYYCIVNIQSLIYRRDCVCLCVSRNLSFM